MVLRFGAGLALLAVVAAVLLIGPRGRNDVSLADIRAALQTVNAWHLKGWKVEEGKRVPWEVWARRQPFFYYERVDNRVVMDNGRQRLQAYPAWPPMRPEGFALGTASRQAPEDLGWNWASRFRDVPGSAARTLDAGGHVVFEEKDVNVQGVGTLSRYLYTVDRSSRLPVHFEVRRGLSGNADLETAETLDAEYDVPVPASIETPTQLQELASVIDTARRPSAAGTPAGSRASAAS